MTHDEVYPEQGDTCNSCGSENERLIFAEGGPFCENCYYGLRVGLRLQPEEEPTKHHVGYHFFYNLGTIEVVILVVVLMAFLMIVAQVVHAGAFWEQPIEMPEKLTESGVPYL